MNEDFLGKLNIFLQVVSQQGFVDWTKETLIPFMYPTKAYNGDNLRMQDTYYVSDLENARVGLVRFRQVRANEGKYWRYKTHTIFK